MNMPHVTFTDARASWLDGGLEALELVREDGLILDECQHPLEGYILESDEERITQSVTGNPKGMAMVLNALKKNVDSMWDGVSETAPFIVAVVVAVIIALLLAHIPAPLK